MRSGLVFPAPIRLLPRGHWATPAGRQVSQCSGVSAHLPSAWLSQQEGQVDPGSDWRRHALVVTLS